MTKEDLIKTIEESADVGKDNIAGYWRTIGRLEAAYWADIIDFDMLLVLLDKACNTYIGCNTEKGENEHENK